MDYDNRLVLKESKEPLFDSQFSITIENTNLINNAFSEKIIDCFQTKTIPIYYGPDNIGDFFNLDGIFHVKNLSEIIEICNNLSLETYNSKINAIEENHQLSMKYTSFDNSMISQTKKILDIK